MTTKYAVISASRDAYDLSVMCTALDVSLSGYHAAQRRAPSARATADEALRLAVRTMHAASRRRYGAPRIQHALRTAGTRVATKRVARLMRADGLVARRPRRAVRTTMASPSAPSAPNLLARQFAVPVPAGLDRVWVSDITYVPTRAGWLFLAVVLDLASRRVVGWAMRDTLEEVLVLDALQMALTQRRPAVGLLHHSDRGSQYAGGAYRALLATRGIACSMSRKGNCWDNAVAESFFATLEHELLADADFASRHAAQRAIFEFIEVWYNRERLHSTLGYLSPVQYEAAHAAA
jgi:putative transposase